MDDYEKTSEGRHRDAMDMGRREALRCLAWSGVGVVWMMHAGVPRVFAAGDPALATYIKRSDFVFAQISDSHIGFNKEANPDPGATLQAALDQVRAIRPAFLLHTGDVSHLSKPEEFDTAAQLIGSTRLDTYYVPGEHDVLNDDPQLFFNRFTPTAPQGWYSFDYRGVHFIALVNVLNFKAGGLGHLGAEQLRWLDDDLRGKSNSMPIVVFTHIPLWNVYSEWGWATDDSEQALTLLRRFGSVTILNGHIHQVIQKVEGNVVFHSARSTAYPQPAPGKAAGPGPLKLPAEQLRSALGISEITVAARSSTLAIQDRTLDQPATVTNESFFDSIFVGD